MKRLITFIFCLVFLSILSVSGQNKTSTPDTTSITASHIIELYDGSVFSGKIISRNATNILLETTSRTKIDIQVTQIKSIKAIKPELSWPNQFPDKYFFSPTAINLKKSEAYYMGAWCYSLNPVLPGIFINSFTYGFSDNFSVGMGIDAVTLINSKQPFYFINPKVGFKIIDKFYVGANIYYVNTGNSIQDTSTIVLGSGMLTYGTEESNITATVGTGYSRGEFINKPTVTLGGIAKMSKRLYLVTDNWLLPIREQTHHSKVIDNQIVEWNTYNYNYNLYISYGLRVAISPRFLIDIGFINNKKIFNTIFIGSPYLDFAVKF